MRCLTMSKGTVIEESKLCFPADVNLRKVAPGNHFGTYLTGMGVSLRKTETGPRSTLTEWEDVNQPLSRRETTLDGVHGFVCAVKYRIIGRFDTQPVRDFQNERIGQALRGMASVVGAPPTHVRRRDRQFRMLSVASGVLLEANQEGIRSPAQRVLVSLDGARSHVLVKQPTVGFPFLPVSHSRKCPTEPKPAEQSEDRHQLWSPGLGVKRETHNSAIGDCGWRFRGGCRSGCA